MLSFTEFRLPMHTQASYSVTSDMHLQNDQSQPSLQIQVLGLQRGGTFVLPSIHGTGLLKFLYISSNTLLDCAEFTLFITSIHFLSFRLLSAWSID